MQNVFIRQLEIRWSDLDPNFHVLHSKYYDFGAYCRTCFLVENGMTPAFMASNNIGPILFREEALFKKELSFGDELSVSLEVIKCTKDMSRWSMRHELFKNKKTLAAIITIDGAWINTLERKLAVPPVTLQHMFETAPRSKDFLIIE
jgi:acyl-CoA thioester hydrolase